MFEWLRGFFGKNGKNGNGKIKKSELQTKSQKMVIDLQRLNEDFAEAMKKTENCPLTCEAEAKCDSL